MGKRKIKYRARAFLYRCPNALPAFHYFFGNGWKKYCGKETDICIEGYPSTANTFVYNVFKNIYKKRISHHTHSIANVKRAMEYGIPTIILCRHPKEAVTSRCVRFNVGLREALLQYMEFYDYITKLKGRILISDFETSTEKVNNLIKKFESFSGIDKDSNQETSKLKSEAKENINRWSERNDKSKSVPSKSREKKKKNGKKRDRRKRRVQKVRKNIFEDSFRY